MNRAYTKFLKSKDANAYKRRRKNRYARKYPLHRPFPATRKVTLKYHETIQLPTGASGVPGLQVYRLGSLADPSYTNTAGTSSNSNHQYMYHDDFSLLYSKYCVTSVGYKIQLMNRDSQSAGYVRAQLVVNASGSGVGITSDDFDALIESNQSRHYCILGSKDSMPSKTWKGRIDFKKVEGRKVDKEEDYQASFDAGPTRTPYLCIYVQSVETAENPTNLYVDVTFYATTLLYEPKTQVSVN